jgi:hypothetical protein
LPQAKTDQQFLEPAALRCVTLHVVIVVRGHDVGDEWRERHRILEQLVVNADAQIRQETVRVAVVGL